MIDETGVVMEKKADGAVLVKCRKTSACKGCASSSLCSLGRDNGVRLVEAHNPLNAVEGDVVRLETTTHAFYESAFLIYIVPVFGMVAGMVAGQKMASVVGLDPNVGAVCGAIMLLVAVFLGMRQLNRHLPRDRYMPTVVEILDETEEETDGDQTDCK